MVLKLLILIFVSTHAVSCIFAYSTADNTFKSAERAYGGSNHAVLVDWVRGWDEEPDSPSKWKQFWGDEFDSGFDNQKEDLPLFTSTWSFESGRPRVYGNYEAQQYVDGNLHPEAVIKNVGRAYVPTKKNPKSNGMLYLRAYCESNNDYDCGEVNNRGGNRQVPWWTISSASIYSKQDLPNVGRFSARVKVKGDEKRGNDQDRNDSIGSGIWPAFWSLGTDLPWPNYGETDIMEFGDRWRNYGQNVFYKNNPYSFNAGRWLTHVINYSNLHGNEYQDDEGFRIYSMERTWVNISSTENPNESFPIIQTRLWITSKLEDAFKEETLNIAYPNIEAGCDQKCVEDYKETFSLSDKNPKHKLKFNIAIGGNLGEHAPHKPYQLAKGPGASGTNQNITYLKQLFVPGNSLDQPSFSDRAATLCDSNPTLDKEHNRQVMCSDRVLWLMKWFKKSLGDARRQVGREFKVDCGCYDLEKFNKDNTLAKSDADTGTLWI